MSLAADGLSAKEVAHQWDNPEIIILQVNVTMLMSQLLLLILLPVVYSPQVDSSINEVYRHSPCSCVITVTALHMHSMSKPHIIPWVELLVCA